MDVRISETVFVLFPSKEPQSVTSSSSLGLLRTESMNETCCVVYWEHVVNKRATILNS